MDERELKTQIKRNIKWCIQLAEDITKEKHMPDSEFAEMVKLIQKELHFNLNNLSNQERHKELLSILKNKIS